MTAEGESGEEECLRLMQRLLGEDEAQETNEVNALPMEVENRW